MLAREIGPCRSAASPYLNGYRAPSTAAFLEKLAAGNGGIERLFGRAGPLPFPSRRRGKARWGRERRGRSCCCLPACCSRVRQAGWPPNSTVICPPLSSSPSVQGAVWAVAAALVLRGRDQRPALALILGTAVLLRLIALAAPVFLSDDINRYIWDGRVQAAGINPYRYIPTDPELEPLRDPLIFPNINRNNYAPTIYPPVAQMLFLVANRFGETALAVKLVFVTIEAVGIGTLLFILRADRAAAGAHPALRLAPAAGMGDCRLGACRRGGRHICRPGARRRRQRNGASGRLWRSPPRPW